MIYLTQLICPQRHCILAVAWDAKDATQAEIETMLPQKLRELGADPWCRLCKATVLHCETRVTGWATLEEALPSLTQCEQEQQLTADWLTRTRH